MSRPRDWTAEVDAAVDAVTRPSAGPVSVLSDTCPRTVRFEESVKAPPADGWMRFSGRLGEISVEGSTLRVGLGTPDDEDRRGRSAIEIAREVGAAAGSRLTGGEVALAFPDRTPELVPALVDGLVAGFSGGGPLRLLVSSDAVTAADQGLLMADVVRLARTLVSAPANVLTPASAARWAEEIAGRTGLESLVLGSDEIRDQGFRALEAIGVGSACGPRLVRLRYRSPAGGPTLGLVGKGITFDSGGLSLKSPAAMQSMRMDVAGAATVLAVMAALPRIGCRIDVQATLPFAENLPGPGAMRPGDVVTAWNGTQIQLLDLDFEGRVVLADALALAAADSPDLLVDLATLTYQAEIALGPDIAAVLGRDDAAVDQVLAAAAVAGEPMARLPWAARYLDQVRMPFGVRNHPLHDTGRALTAALFLGEFVPPAVPWAHCDMTGPAWHGDPSGDGGTGFGARTLLALTESISARAGGGSYPGYGDVRSWTYERPH